MDSVYFRVVREIFVIVNVIFIIVRLISHAVLGSFYWCGVVMIHNGGGWGWGSRSRSRNRSRSARRSWDRSRGRHGPTGTGS